ncbi:MAG: hypothetical protein IT464_08805 [Planctomycetes bacterium]|nr:hypothetical protein [Planctomycetota bacterium]
MEVQSQPRRAPVWLIVLCVLPLALGGAVFAWLQFGGAGSADTPAANSGPKLPDLGSRGKDLANAPAAGTNEAAGNSADGGETPVDGGEVPPPEVAENTEREIDILIGRIQHATKVGDRRGRESAHAELRKCRPSGRVDARLTFHIENEQSAWARIEFFKAYHAEQERRTWALRVLDTRTNQWLGTTDQYAAGELEELKLYLETLLPMLFEGPSRDERLMALLRSTIDAEKPEWLLVPLFQQLLRLHKAVKRDEYKTGPGGVTVAIRENLRRMLERQTAPEELRFMALWLWITSLDDWSTALLELEQTALKACLPMLVRGLPRRDRSGGIPIIDDKLADALEQVGPGRAWAVEHAQEIADLVKRMVTQPLGADIIRALIATVAERAIPDALLIVEAGVSRKDEYLPAWLTALGCVGGEAVLQRLTQAADDPDPLVAQGAVEGLRRSPTSGADAELRRVLEQGANIAVKSQALGAMLDRSDNKTALLDEYLDVNKDASLRAVAVAHIPRTDVERMKGLVENDPSLRVRQAALTRLGELKDKSLRTWFLRIKERDPSPVLRQQAHRYADELED